MRQPSTLDLRPSARSSLPSSSSLSVPRSPPHTLSRSPPAPTSPYQPHQHPPPSRENDRSISFFLPRSDPTIRPQPQPFLLPPTLSLSTVSVESHPRQPPRSSPTLLRLLAPPLSPHPLALSFSRVPTYLLTTFTLGSVSAPPCQFLCETTNGAARYLPT